MNRHAWKNRERTAEGAAKDSRLSGAELKFGGRTLELRILINTDEDAREVAERLREHARGPHHRMVLITGGEVAVDDAEDVWRTAWDAAVEMERSRS